jgi:hypothetical protein
LSPIARHFAALTLLLAWLPLTGCAAVDAPASHAFPPDDTLEKLSVRTPIPDGQNAYPLLMKASGLYSKLETDDEVTAYQVATRFTSQFPTNQFRRAIEDWLRRNGPCLELISGGLTLNRLQFPPPRSRPTAKEASVS